MSNTIVGTIRRKNIPNLVRRLVDALAEGGETVEIMIEPENPRVAAVWINDRLATTINLGLGAPAERWTSAIWQPSAVEEG